MSGGNVSSWQRALSYQNSGTDLLHYEVWWGVATTTGASNISVAYSAPTSSYQIELVADSFHEILDLLCRQSRFRIQKVVQPGSLVMVAEPGFAAARYQKRHDDRCKQGEEVFLEQRRSWGDG